MIDELIQLAKKMRAATQCVEDLGLNDDDMCLYNALVVNESAVHAMGIDELKISTAELVTSIRKCVIINWTVRPRHDSSHGPPHRLRGEALRMHIAVRR